MPPVALHHRGELLPAALDGPEPFEAQQRVQVDPAHVPGPVGGGPGEGDPFVGHREQRLPDASREPGLAAAGEPGDEEVVAAEREGLREGLVPGVRPRGGGVGGVGGEAVLLHDLVVEVVGGGGGGGGGGGHRRSRSHGTTTTTTGTRGWGGREGARRGEEGERGVGGAGRE